MAEAVLDGDAEDVKSCRPTGMRGIGTAQRDSQTHYKAQVAIDGVHLVCKERRELSQALDDLMVITSIKQRAACGKGADDFAVRFRAAVETALDEHALSFEDLGLTVHIEIRRSLWAGNERLITPTANSLASALDDIGCLVPLIGRLPRFRKCLNMRFADAQRDWDAFRTAYVDLCERRGWERGALVQKLDALQHRSQWFNRLAMAREDRPRWRFSKRDRIEMARPVRACRRLLALWRRRSAASEKRAQSRQLQQRRASKRETEAARRSERRNRPRFDDLTFEQILRGVRSRSDV